MCDIRRLPATCQTGGTLCAGDKAAPVGGEYAEDPKHGRAARKNQKRAERKAALKRHASGPSSVAGSDLVRSIGLLTCDIVVFKPSRSYACITAKPPAMRCGATKSVLSRPVLIQMH